MANQIYIPYASPVRFHLVDPVQLPQYLSKHMDDYWIHEQFPGREYNQKWMTVDAVPLQLEANFGPITVRVINCDGTILLTQTATLKRTNKYFPSLFVYETTISWASFSPGIYFIVLVYPGGTMEVSDPQEVAIEHPGTMLYRYSNTSYHADILWETGYIANFRVESRFRKFDPGNERTAYRDQKLNPSVLKSIPYRTWDLVVGADYGVPDWVADTMNWIFSCDTVQIDGRLYAVFEDNKWQGDELDPQYPMRVWTLKVQEGLNRASKITDVAVDTNKRILVGVQIDGTIFGDLSAQAGSNLTPINDIE